MKKVLDVGQCDPDHNQIRRFLEGRFEVEVVRTHGLEDTLEQLRADSFSLVLINRKFDRDYTDGIEILKQIKADPSLAAVGVMLVTNYPEHQDQAEAAGAARGFGKLEFAKPETAERLAKFLV